MITVEIGKLTLHNFTLQMPLMDITINRVIAVNRLYLSECSSFAINSLFAFFLKQGKQIDEIGFVQCKMDPDSAYIGERLVSLGNPKTLIVSKTLLPFDLEEDESVFAVLGLVLSRLEKLVLRDLLIKDGDSAV